MRQVKGTDNPDEIQRILLQITRTKEYQKLCQSAAMKMVTGLFSDQGHTWRQAAAANGKGRIIYEALWKELQGPAGQRMRELIDDATYRIVTLPLDIGHDVADYVARESLKGRRASDIAEEIKKMFPEKTTARAELIARTQTSMTSTSLTWERAERLGAHWYIWRAVGDARTRHSHEKMEGVLVNWNDPPAPEDLFPILNADGKPRRNTLAITTPDAAPTAGATRNPLSTWIR